VTELAAADVPLPSRVRRFLDAKNAAAEKTRDSAGRSACDVSARPSRYGVAPLWRAAQPRWVVLCALGAPSI